MATQIKSVFRPEPGAGVATPKGEYVYIYFTDDIAKDIDVKPGVTVYSEGFELKEGAKGIKFYTTPGTIEAAVEKTGDQGAVGFTHGLKWAYPGSGADGAIAQLANRPFVAFHQTCKGGIARRYGSKCAPLCFSDFAYTDNKEANKREPTYKGAYPEAYLPIDYTGELPPVDETDLTESETA